jgi:branched-chain amino acid transport system ATP-binding protein
MRTGTAMDRPDDALLSVRHLGVRFGGVLAVNDVSFDVHEGEVFTLIGPNGAGKTTVFNLISRIYDPTSGTIDYRGADGAVVRLTQQPPHAVAELGIARTFQNIELFEHATVLQNLLIGRHVHRQQRVVRSVHGGARPHRRRSDLWNDFCRRNMPRR